MSVHPWANHEIAALRHQERIARAAVAGHTSHVLESRRAQAGAVRRSILSELVGLRRKRSFGRSTPATPAPRPS